MPVCVRACVCMCVCVCVVHVYACALCVCTCLQAYIRMCAHVSMCMCACMYVILLLYMCVHNLPGGNYLLRGLNAFVYISASTCSTCIVTQRRGRVFCMLMHARDITISTSNA